MNKVGFKYGKDKSVDEKNLTPALSYYTDDGVILSKSSFLLRFWGYYVSISVIYMKNI